MKTDDLRIRLVVVTLVAVSWGLIIPRALADKQAGSVNACPKAAAWSKGFHEKERVEERQFDGITPSNPGLVRDLARRADLDQSADQEWIKSHNRHDQHSASLRHALAVHKSNSVWLKSWVEENGFPTIHQVGIAGVKNAWLLVQHADADPAFQMLVLTQLKMRLNKEPFLREQYALLTDRVRLGYLHEKQLYGTQFAFRDGRMSLSPTEDPEDLAKRRRSMGLMPMQEYRCIVRAAYHISK